MATNKVYSEKGKRKIKRIDTYMDNHRILTDIVVIIPVYNCKQYIKQAVESVLNQPYTKIKIVLVDDGSTDGSSEICDCLSEWNDKIKVIHQNNSGVSNARNAGIDYVIENNNNDSNNYIAFLDADDAWFSNAIDDTVLGILLKGYDLLGLQACKTCEDMQFYSPAMELDEGIYSGGVESLWRFSTQHFAAMLYKVSFLREYNLRFTNVKYSEDKIFSMQCLYLANTVYLYNKKLYAYRQNNLSVMHTRKYGIEYYPPIVDAYLACDLEMSKWVNHVRGELREGTTLARWYLMDMIEEHYQYGGSRQEMAIFLVSNPNYISLLNNNEVGTSYISKRWEIIKKYPRIIEVKNRIRGLIYRCCKSVSRQKIFEQYIKRKKYPLKL